MTDLLGRPIEGEISHYSERSPREQYSPERLLEMLDAVFAADERVTALGWRQYTPYFNDGDPCYFGIHSESSIAINEIPTDLGWEGFIFDGFDEEYEEGCEVNQLTVGYGVGEDATGPLLAAGEAFYNALNWGHFDNVVKSAFGDPATVIATRAGFKVEFCDHD